MVIADTEHLLLLDAKALLACAKALSTSELDTQLCKAVIALAIWSATHTHAQHINP